ncbi:MAG: hypothetical protein QCI38_03825 [Candidatus Thermoplasmatota archaeon]|nr:hypothetical protein [Candidatus Thermoplasmatota archaeon]
MKHKFIPLLAMIPLVTSMVGIELGLDRDGSIFAGFFILAILLSAAVVLIVVERIRFPLQMDLSSLKSQLEAEGRGEEAKLKDMDISSVSPPSIFPDKTKGKYKNETKPQEAPKPKAPVPEKNVPRRKSTRTQIAPKKTTARPEPKPSPPRLPTVHHSPPAPPPPPPAPKPGPAPPAETPFENEDELRTKMREVEGRIQEAKLKDIDTSGLENMMRDAKKSLASREFSRTATFLDNIDRRIDDLMEKREAARKAIRDAQTIIYGLKYTDMDTSQIRSFITRAETAYKTGDFIEAIKNAQKAKDRGEDMEKQSRNNHPPEKTRSDNDFDDDFDSVTPDDEVRL